MHKDRITEELNWLRTAFPVLAAAVAGLVAYAMQDAPVPTVARLFALVWAAIAVGVTGAVLVKIYRLLKALEVQPHG